MRKTISTTAALLAAGSLAAVTIPATLPPAVHADTETTTNVPFTAALDAWGRFKVTLSCRATPSNNVEVAFGVDRNADGVLGLEEMERVVGWDCGRWFVRAGVDGEPHLATSPVPAEDVKTLTLVQRFDRAGRPTSRDVRVDGVPFFTESDVPALYSPDWNMMRLTGRGLDARLETFTVVVTPDGTVIRMR